MLITFSLADALELSDEEILGYSSDEEEDEDEEDVEDEEEEYNERRGAKGAQEGSDEEAGGEDEDDIGGWGTSKKDYYDADNLETEADALEEEAEAKRLQKKKLQKMSEADFGFDENEWADTGKEGDDEDKTVEVLKDIEITDDMSTEERLKILNTRYPEFDFLANEFLELQPLLESLRLEVESANSTLNGSTKTTSPLLIKHRALAAYVSSLTMYFAILTSPARTGEEKTSVLDPAELRNHSVMDSLLQCRQLWTKVKSLKAGNEEMLDGQDGDEEIQVNGVALEPEPVTLHDDVTPKKTGKKQQARDNAVSEAALRRAKQREKAERELAELSELVPKPRKASRRLEKAVVAADDDSDFGEEETMDAREAAEKASKKKSLRFYTSQIVQKANKRADAGRDAGGDADLPYRERLRDRQARLNAEAEKRGKKLDEYGRGAALGGDSSDEDEATAEVVRGEEDEYYDLVAQTSKKKRAEKDAKYEAIAQAKAQNKLVRVVDGEVGEDGKRAIGYTIEKNKGLAQKRSKDVRNPRVKKRKQFAAKQKKLSSIRAVYKGGEGRGGYGGEKTGIKTGLVKSIKL